MKAKVSFVSLFTVSAVFSALVFTGACTRPEPKREVAEVAEISQRQRILEGVKKVQEYALNPKQMKEDSYWNFPLYMGIGYTSQYYLFTKWLGIKDPKLDEKKLLQYILDPSYRLSDGSWYQVKDPKLEEGHLDSTIMNYWAMKVMGTQADSELENKRREAMEGAKKFINSKGGVLQATLFAKVVLSLFSQVSWSEFLMFIPPKIDPTSDSIQKDFAQWVRPHLIPIVYMRYLRVRKVMSLPDGTRDSRFDLSEIGAPLVGDVESPEYGLSKDDFNAVVNEYQKFMAAKPLKAIETILATQQPRGSWGGYTSATLFSLISIDDYLRRNPKFEAEYNARAKQKSLPSIAKIREKAVAFTSGYYVDNGLSNYLGTVCDGRYWDTILVHRGLTESDNAMTPEERAVYSVYPVEKAKKVAEYLMNAQLDAGPKKGGIPFGYEFEYAPDVDDTAELVTAYASTVEFLINHGVEKQDPLIKKLRKRMESGLNWILKMQNDDGGWAAFDRNNNGNLFYDIALSNFKDSADLFDDSSEDVTGHVLEAIGRAKPFLSSAMAKGVRIDTAKRGAFSYLWKTQKWKGDKKNRLGTGGGWYGRWGINYVYGTNAALVGVFNMISREQIAQVNGESFNRQLINDLWTGTSILGFRGALQWLESVQSNRDGGFGESIRSYLENDWIGKGESTPSQTAWGLAALAAGGRAQGDAAQRAVKYLMDHLTPLPEGGAKWTDGAVVGTGHPEIVYLEYPSYPIAFPLIALGEYLKQH